MFEHPRIIENEPLPQNVKPYFGPESLPPGSILQRECPQGWRPLDHFVSEVSAQLGITKRNKAINTYLKDSMVGRNIGGHWFGSLVSGMQDGYKKSFDIAYKMAELEPRLAWMRGGSLRVHNGVAILEDSSKDGLVGGSVESFAKHDYEWKPREEPVIYRIDWIDVVDAARSGLFRPCTHHLYDFSMMWSVEKPEAVDWQRQHLVAYLLDKSLLKP